EGSPQAAIGSAAVGMLAEDGSKFGVALIFTALPESIVILGALPLFLN
ncbi:MAG TPA: F0F1 ATP synthase subunit C, partial [Candidatus Poseidoniales archaeon]